MSTSRGPVLQCNYARPATPKNCPLITLHRHILCSTLGTSIRQVSACKGRNLELPCVAHGLALHMFSRYHRPSMSLYVDETVQGLTERTTSFTRSCAIYYMPCLGDFTYLTMSNHLTRMRDTAHLYPTLRRRELGASLNVLHNCELNAARRRMLGLDSRRPFLSAKRYIHFHVLHYSWPDKV